jgi:hypothetical protein
LGIPANRTLQLHFDLTRGQNYSSSMKTTTHLNGVVSLVALSITACTHASTKNSFPLSSARFALSRPRRSSSSPSAVALEQTNERHFVQQATWKRVWRANSIDGVSSCHVRKWWDIKVSQVPFLAMLCSISQRGGERRIWNVLFPTVVITSLLTYHLLTYSYK